MKRRFTWDAWDYDCTGEAYIIAKDQCPNVANVPNYIGLGQYFRGLTEHCIFATTRKRLPYKLTDGRRMQGVTGFVEPKREHSRKPETMRHMIERVSYAPRIELFARQAVDGWATWGDEVPLQEVGHED